MEVDDNRLSPPVWRHDAYTLRRLAISIRSLLNAGLDSARSIHGSKAGVAVDIGAGNTPYRSLFTERGLNYIGCDIDVDELGASAPQVRIAPGQQIPLEALSADWVVSFQVLEHVWDLDWYLGEAKRLLKPEGRLLISTHGTWLYHPHPTDYRRWTRDGLVKELETRGFNVVSICADVGPLAWTTQFRCLAYHHVISKVPLLGRWLSAGFCALMYLRMMVEDMVTPAQLINDNAAVYTILAVHA